MAQKTQKLQKEKKKRLSNEQRRMRTNQIIFAIIALLMITAMILALVAK